MAFVGFLEEISSDWIVYNCDFMYNKHKSRDKEKSTYAFNSGNQR